MRLGRWWRCVGLGRGQVPHLQEGAQHSVGAAQRMWQEAKEKPQLTKRVRGVNTGPVTRSYPCIQLNNSVHHSCIIHPSNFPFLTKLQPHSTFLLAVFLCVCFLLSWLYEVRVK